MIAKNSSLKIVTLDIIKFDYSFNFNREGMEGRNIENVLASYIIDIDYSIHLIEDEYNILLKLLVNQDNSLPGYNIELRCGSVFKLEESLSEDTAAFFIRDSALPIVISFIRTFLMTTTANFPFGRYTLPAIDMHDLYVKKIKEDKPKPKRKIKRAPPKQAAGGK